MVHREPRIPADGRPMTPAQADQATPLGTAEHGLRDVGDHAELIVAESMPPTRTGARRIAAAGAAALTAAAIAIWTWRRRHRRRLTRTERLKSTISGALDGARSQINTGKIRNSARAAAKRARTEMAAREFDLVSAP